MKSTDPPEQVCEMHAKEREYILTLAKELRRPEHEIWEIVVLAYYHNRQQSGAAGAPKCNII